MSRTAPDELESRYRASLDRPSDILTHLPTLRDLASRCEHVTEFGTRGGNSTLALLAGQPRVLATWDVNPAAIVSNAIADLCNHAGETRFEPRVGNTLEIEIEETDLLFIDSLHTARHLKAELLRHGWRVRRYLAFHDTETYGMRGEDGSEPGLLAAIRWWQREEAFPLWQLAHQSAECNGFVVLEYTGRNHRPRKRALLDAAANNLLHEPATG